MQPSEIFALISKKFPGVTQEDLTGVVLVPGDKLLEVVDYLRGGELIFDNLHCVTAIDWKGRLELVYIFYSLKNRHQINLKISLPLSNPEVESLAGVYRSADWFEREVYDLFGVRFLNHPDLRRILNPYDWKGYPLRKDYSNPDLIRKPRY